MGGFGQFVVTTQFYLFGRRHFTATGWKRASAKYDVAGLDTLDLSSKCTRSHHSASLRRQQPPCLMNLHLVQAT